MIITFSIPGPVRGKGRPRFVRQGNFARAYTPAETVSYENLVKIAAADAMAGMPPSTAAHEIVVCVYTVPPKSWSKKKRLAALEATIKPTSKPDNDNILKIICDACNGIVWRDDAQVSDCIIRKRYGEVPFVHVTIREME